MQPGSAFVTEEIEILFAGSLFARGRWSPQVNGQKVPHDHTALGDCEVPLRNRGTKAELRCLVREDTRGVQVLGSCSHLPALGEQI